MTVLFKATDVDSFTSEVSLVCNGDIDSAWYPQAELFLRFLQAQGFIVNGKLLADFYEKESFV